MEDRHGSLVSSAIERYGSIRKAFVEDSSEDSYKDKLLRETQLLAQGVNSIKEAAQAAFVSENLSGTATKVGVSAGIGYAISRFVPKTGLSGMVLQLGLAAGAPAFFMDIVRNGSELANAMSDTWNSNSISQSSELAVNHVGQFLFDTTLMSAGGLVGDKLGNRYLTPVIQEHLAIASKTVQELAGVDLHVRTPAPMICGLDRVYPVEKRVISTVAAENTLSLKELAAKGDPSFAKTLDAYYPKLSNAFPDKAEIEAKSTYDRYLRDASSTWDALALRDKNGEIIGGIQSQVIPVNGEQLKNAVWAEHIWLSPDARNYQNFSQLLKIAKTQFGKSNSNLVFMEFNDRAKMNWSQLTKDAEGGLATEAREKIWARVGLNVLTDKRGKVAPYAQPGMDGEEPVTYLSLGMAAAEPLAGKFIPTSDYIKLLKAAHSTIVDVETDPTVKQYTTKLNQMIANGETHLTFARLSDTVVERLVRGRLIS